MKRQEGVTLVEMLVAIAISGLIISFLGTAIYQTLTVTGYGNDRLTAMHELQNAAYWFNADGQEAKVASTGGGLSLTLADNSSITYSLVGTELQRTADARMILARNITLASFTIANRVVTMSLTSSPAGPYGVSENGTYKVNLRPEGEP
jgi:prepilin-type N-terminal cleavage/methylation domain-containing protein